MAQQEFAFPVMSPGEIAVALLSYGIAPRANLSAEDIAKPGPDLLPSIFIRFLTEICREDVDQQLGFEVLSRFDNPENYLDGFQTVILFQKSRQFLESIQFPGLTLRDLYNPTPQRVRQCLSAIINYLHFRQEKIALLQPVLDEFPATDEHKAELKAKIAEHRKAIEDHEIEEKMCEPVVEQLQKEIEGLLQKIQELNKEQGALRVKAKAIDEENREINRKIIEADFDLTKQTQMRSGLLSKVVQSPEKLKRALEEKKAHNAQLRNKEKTLIQTNQEKENTLEMYTKAHEKLSKRYSKICAVQEQAAAAKSVEKEVKALKAKLCDQNLENDKLAAQLAECQRKALETEERLKLKESERDRRISDSKRKMAAFGSEMERKNKGLIDREIKAEEMFTKASRLLDQADAVEAEAAKKKEALYAKYVLVCKVANHLVERVDAALDSSETCGS